MIDDILKLNSPEAKEAEEEARKKLEEETPEFTKKWQETCPYFEPGNPHYEKPKVAQIINSEEIHIENMNELNEVKKPSIMKEYEKEILQKKINEELNTGKLTPQEEEVVKGWIGTATPTQENKPENEEGGKHEIEVDKESAIPGDFNGICRDLMALHARKNNDYGNAAHESYKEFGLISYVIRLNDKMKRLKSLTKPGSKQEVKSESIEDTLMDLAAYSIMAIESLRS